jgi:uncharacterized damage-inducible protein DinB
MNAYHAFLVRNLESGLEAVPALIRAFPVARLDEEIRAGEWSVRRHAHHLRHIERRYLERLEGVIEGTGRIPEPVHHQPPPEDEPIEAILEGFADARRRSIAVFRGLGDDRWSTVFNHPTLYGLITIEWWAERFVQHTAEHLDELWLLKQITGMQPEAYQRFAASRA